MNKCVILSDLSNHINRSTANEILEYLVGAFEATSLTDNHTTGYSMFLAKVLMDHYTIHLYYLEYYQENIRELLLTLGW